MWEIPVSMLQLYYYLQQRNAISTQYLMIRMMTIHVKLWSLHFPVVRIKLFSYPIK